ncbi:PBSX family phage terminase large subunit [Candidatus Saccharibacteria bacterium]|nr:PBSX family phage terminase large subunit [Candidatus Saccharibacteria bacterium]
MNDNKAKIIVPEPFTELVSPSKHWRHIAYHGGRSSGKSTTVATILAAQATSKPLRVLCCREVQNSIAESVHKLLGDMIEKYKLPGWEITREAIRNRNGSEFIFKGVHNNAQNIKSLEGVDICWVEEAQSISMESIDILIPTIRKSGSYFIWTFNRLTNEDPVWTRVAGNPDDRTFVRQVNSDEIEMLLSGEVIHEREKMRKENPELFEHVWLGQPLTANTGSVFGRQLARAREDGRIGSVVCDDSLGVYTAWDLGVGDATAIWFFQVTSGGEIHFIDHYESSGEDLGHYISIIQNKPYQYNKHFLPHDANARELQTNMTRVDFFRNRGINNVEVLRPTKFTLGQDDISLVARPKFSKCWFDEKKCQRGLECLRAYHYEYNEKNKLLKDKPCHDWSSHSSSAFIYAMMAETEQIEIQNHFKFETYTPPAFKGDQKTGF